MTKNTIYLFSLSLISCVQLVGQYDLEVFLTTPWDRRYFGVLHNLGLAWVPYLISRWLYKQEATDMNIYFLFFVHIIWLLFLPNAAYLVTDLVYINHTGGIPGQKAVILFASFAITGLFLFWTSIRTMQQTVYGLRTNGAAVVIIGLSAIGVWMGRMLRWQSWDVIRPGKLLAELRVVELVVEIGWIGLLYLLLLLPYFLIYQKELA